MTTKKKKKTRKRKTSFYNKKGKKLSFKQLRVPVFNKVPVAVVCCFLLVGTVAAYQMFWSNDGNIVGQGKIFVQGYYNSVRVSFSAYYVGGSTVTVPPQGYTWVGLEPKQYTVVGLYNGVQVNQSTTVVASQTSNVILNFGLDGDIEYNSVYLSSDRQGTSLGTSVVKYGSYYYMAVSPNSPGTIRVLEIDPSSLTVLRDVVVVTLAGGGDPHLKPSIAVTPDGTLYVFSCYYITPLRCWASSVSSLSFTPIDTGISGLSYSAAFGLPDNRVMLIMRGNTQLMMVYGKQGGSWSVHATPWVYPTGGGLQDNCYYHSPVFQQRPGGGWRLYMTATGWRQSSVYYEVRHNVYYGYSDDYGLTWVGPTEVWTGLVSRVEMWVDSSNENIYALMSYLYQNTATYYKLLWRDGGTWKTSDMPLEPGEWARAVSGFWCVRRVGTYVHAFLCVSNSGLVGQLGDIYHYYSQAPFISWTRTQLTTGQNSGREVCTFSEGVRILAFYFMTTTGPEYMWEVTGLPF